MARSHKAKAVAITKYLDFVIIEAGRRNADLSLNFHAFYGLQVQQLDSHHRQRAIDQRAIGSGDLTVSDEPQAGECRDRDKGLTGHNRLIGHCISQAGTSLHKSLKDLI